MSQIEEVSSGAIAKNSKLNEVIRAVNSLTGMQVREGSANETPKLVIADRNTVLITTGGGGSGGDGTLELDYVDSDNAVQTATFLIQ